MALKNQPDVRVTVYDHAGSLLKLDASADFAGGNIVYENRPDGCGAGTMRVGLLWEDCIARGYYDARNIVEVSTADDALTASCGSGATKLYVTSTAAYSGFEPEGQQIYLYNGTTLTMRVPVTAVGSDGGGPFLTVGAPVAGGGNPSSIPAYAAGTFVGRRRYAGQIIKRQMQNTKLPQTDVQLGALSARIGEALGTFTLTNAANVDIGTAIYQIVQQFSARWPEFTISAGNFGTVGSIASGTYQDQTVDRVASDLANQVTSGDLWTLYVGHDRVVRFIKLYDSPGNTYTYNITLNQGVQSFEAVDVKNDDQDASTLYNSFKVIGDIDPASKQPVQGIFQDATSIGIYGQIDYAAVTNVGCKTIVDCQNLAKAIANAQAIARQTGQVRVFINEPGNGPLGIPQGDVISGVSNVKIQNFEGTSPDIYGICVSAQTTLDAAQGYRYQDIKFSAIEPDWNAALAERGNALASSLLGNTYPPAAIDQYVVSSEAYPGNTVPFTLLNLNIPTFRAIFGQGTVGETIAAATVPVVASSTNWVWLSSLDVWTVLQVSTPQVGQILYCIATANATTIIGVIPKAPVGVVKIGVGNLDFAPNLPVPTGTFTVASSTTASSLATDVLITASLTNASASQSMYGLAYYFRVHGTTVYTPYSEQNLNGLPNPPATQTLPGFVLGQLQNSVLYDFAVGYASLGGYGQIVQIGTTDQIANGFMPASIVVTTPYIIGTTSPEPSFNMLGTTSDQFPGWAASGGGSVGTGGPSGATDYEITGTGAASGTQLAYSPITPVIPGLTYVFSCWVDPSQITAGSALITIVSADFATLYAYGSTGVGAAARFATTSWLCPSGVTTVRVYMDSNNCTIASGQKLKFSQPMLEANSVASPTYSNMVITPQLSANGIAAAVRLQFTLTNQPTDGSLSRLSTWFKVSGSSAWTFYDSRGVPGLPTPTTVQAYDITLADLTNGQSYDFGVTYENAQGQDSAIVAPLALNVAAADIHLNANNFNTTIPIPTYTGGAVTSGTTPTTLSTDVDVAAISLTGIPQDGSVYGVVYYIANTGTGNWYPYDEQRFPSFPPGTTATMPAIVLAQLQNGIPYDFAIGYVGPTGYGAPQTSPTLRTNFTPNSIVVTTPYLLGTLVATTPSAITITPTASVNGLAANMTVAFTITQPTDGSLSRVSMYFRKSGASAWTSWASIPAIGLPTPSASQAYSFAFTDLTNGVAYEFGVALENTQGGEGAIASLGTSTAQTLAITSQYMLGGTSIQPTVTSPAATARASTNGMSSTFTVTWNITNQPTDGSLSRIGIYMKKNSDSTWTPYASVPAYGVASTPPPASGSYSFDFNDLTNGQIYDFACTFENAQGGESTLAGIIFGQAAQTIAITTPYIIGTTSPTPTVTTVTTTAQPSINGITAAIRLQFTLTNQPTDGSLSRVSIWYRVYAAGETNLGPSTSTPPWTFYDGRGVPGLPTPSASQAYDVTLADISIGQTYDFGVTYENAQGQDSATIGVIASNVAAVAMPATGNLIVDSDFNFCAYNGGSPNLATTATYWTQSGHGQFARYGSPNTGLNNFEVAATWTGISVYSYSQSMTLPPGTYTFSAYVDAVTCSGANVPYIGIWQPNLAGSITVTAGSAAKYQTNGQRGRIQSTFTIGVATTCVFIMNSGAATIASSIIDFSIPQLEAGSIMTPYKSGPASTNTGTVALPALPPPVTNTVQPTPGGDGSYLIGGIVSGRHMLGNINSDNSALMGSDGRFLQSRHDFAVLQGAVTGASKNLVPDSGMQFGTTYWNSGTMGLVGIGSSSFSRGNALYTSVAGYRGFGSFYATVGDWITFSMDLDLGGASAGTMTFIIGPPGFGSGSGGGSAAHGFKGRLSFTKQLLSGDVSGGVCCFGPDFRLLTFSGTCYASEPQAELGQVMTAYVPNSFRDSDTTLPYGIYSPAITNALDSSGNILNSVPLKVNLPNSLAWRSNVVPSIAWSGSGPYNGSLTLDDGSGGTPFITQPDGTNVSGVSKVSSYAWSPLQNLASTAYQWMMIWYDPATSGLNGTHWHGSAQSSAFTPSQLTAVQDKLFAFIASTGNIGKATPGSAFQVTGGFGGGGRKINL